MNVYHSLDEYKKGHKTHVTIGTFDGVHIGHRAILDRIIAEAREVGGESLLISFHPHPRMVLRPDDHSLRLLQTQEEKVAVLNSIGLNKILFIPFTQAFSKLTSDQYIQQILIDTVDPEKIVIGYDHRFGHDRKGGIAELEKYAAIHSYEVEEIPVQAVDDALVSSTKIREALQEGDVSTAAKYLGYEYSFAGEVVHGEKQGRLLGYPTANIDPEDKLKLIPAHGVYFVRVFVEQQAYYGMMNIGVKPTMGEFQPSHEVYIFDFDQMIYGKTIRVSFIEWIRGEKKFNGLDELIAAIDGDRDYCLKRIAELENA